MIYIKLFEEFISTKNESTNQKLEKMIQSDLDKAWDDDVHGGGGSRDWIEIMSTKSVLIFAHSMENEDDLPSDFLGDSTTRIIRKHLKSLNIDYKFVDLSEYWNSDKKPIELEKPMYILLSGYDVNLYNSGQEGSINVLLSPRTDVLISKNEIAELKRAYETRGDYFGYFDEWIETDGFLSAFVN